MINQFQSGLSLTDGDYRALGAVVANWALAETVFLGTLRFLHEHPNVENTEFAQERIRDFRRKVTNWKKSISLICEPDNPYRELGIFLASRGKELKNDRDVACHWPATRIVANPDQSIHFSNNENLFETVKFDTAGLEALAADILEWSANVSAFAVMISFDLMQQPLTGTRVGERPEWMSAILDRYRRTYRKPQIRTKPRPPRQP